MLNIYNMRHADVQFILHPKYLQHHNKNVYNIFETITINKPSIDRKTHRLKWIAYGIQHMDYNNI